MSNISGQEYRRLFSEAVSRFKVNIRGLRPQSGHSIRQLYPQTVAGVALCKGNLRLYSLGELLLSQQYVDINELCDLFPWIPKQLMLTVATLFRYLALADVKDWSSRCLDAIAAADTDEQLEIGYWEFVIWALNDPVYGLRQHMLEEDLETLEAICDWALARACGDKPAKVAITPLQMQYAFGANVRIPRGDAIRALHHIDDGSFVIYLAEANKFCFNYDRLKAISEKLIEFISR